MHRRSLCAAIAATGLLAAPAGALADSSLVAGPVKVKGYDVTLTATDGGSDSMSLMAVKQQGKSMQMHSWSFQDGVNVSIKGTKATLKGSLGKYGSINAKVKAKKKTKGKVPAGCTGNAGNVRTGALKGKTKIKLDSTFFRTFAPKSMKAQIVNAGNLDCSGAGGDGGNGQGSRGLMLTATDDSGGGQLLLSVIKDGGKVAQQFMRTDDATASAPASVMHMITAETGASGLEAAADLSTATVKGAGGFITGALSFAGEPMGTMATGELSGDLTAKFDSIGAQTLPAGTTGMLMQR